ncbi:MAG TPA: HupE/UreJ family protein, partial [Pirellulales bacterium]|nr:HupE/UreJ family protein [Pirellulales bacterium]
SIRTEINHWNTFGSYLRHGIEHILTGYDHLLFVAALVLAAGRFWELVKVVTAFTLAHTLTLAISVFNMFTLDASIVEPMIAASIVLVALQNVLFPERSQGRLRLAIAFGFGLFHGLGFAGGLKEVMSELPGAAIWLALIAFSLGVEIGHQIVVLPLFSAIAVAKRGQRDPAAAVRQRRVMQVASAAITAAGVYFLIESLRW